MPEKRLDRGASLVRGRQAVRARKNPRRGGFRPRLRDVGARCGGELGHEGRNGGPCVFCFHPRDGERKGCSTFRAKKNELLTDVVGK